MCTSLVYVCVNHVCSAAQLWPPVAALILQPGPLSCVRSITTPRQRHIFWAWGLKSGFSVSPNWRRKFSVVLSGEKERRGIVAHCFQTVSLFPPLTVSVPQHSTIEAIVCLGEKAWVFCFNHFSKSCVWHGGGSALPVVGGRLVLCAHFPASMLASVPSALCVILWMETFTVYSHPSLKWWGWRLFSCGSAVELDISERKGWRLDPGSCSHTSECQTWCPESFLWHNQQYVKTMRLATRSLCHHSLSG